MHHPKKLHLLIFHARTWTMLEILLGAQSSSAGLSPSIVVVVVVVVISIVMATMLSPSSLSSSPSSPSSLSSPSLPSSQCSHFQRGMEGQAMPYVPADLGSDRKGSLAAGTETEPGGRDQGASGSSGPKRSWEQGQTAPEPPLKQACRRTLCRGCGRGHEGHSFLV